MRGWTGNCASKRDEKLQRPGAKPSFPRRRNRAWNREFLPGHTGHELLALRLPAPTQCPLQPSRDGFGSWTGAYLQFRCALAWLPGWTSLCSITFWHRFFSPGSRNVDGWRRRGQVAYQEGEPPFPAMRSGAPGARLNPNWFGLRCRKWGTSGLAILSKRFPSWSCVDCAELAFSIVFNFDFTRRFGVSFLARSAVPATPQCCPSATFAAAMVALGLGKWRPILGPLSHAARPLFPFRSPGPWSPKRFGHNSATGSPAVAYVRGPWCRDLSRPHSGNFWFATLPGVTEDSARIHEEKFAANDRNGKYEWFLDAVRLRDVDFNTGGETWRNQSCAVIWAIRPLSLRA